MHFQIILLPQTNYWEWVRACKDYVLAYGALLTPEPATAAGYMRPRQVVTFPSAPGGFLEHEDIERWFRTMHPEISLDPIDAEDPAALSQALAKRIEQGDRYGQRQQAFYLLWPTEYAVITQRFGANPQIYGRFGMPGHEGVDIRALPNTKVFACADGDVYRVHTNPKNHAYGIHVRIRHPGGYRTIYGHLARAMVNKGESVRAGQLIGKANSTGASVGSHLHLSLKHDNATARGETNYPKDIIDPTDFLVWPDQAKSFANYDWPPGRCLVGVHGRLGGVLEERDFDALQQARAEAVVVWPAEEKASIDRLRAMNPGMFLLTRLVAETAREELSPEGFMTMVEKDMGRLYRLGMRWFEVGASPNLQFDGWGRYWSDGTQFSRWFLEVCEKMREAFPDAKLGFPGLAPGDPVSGQRAQALQFLEGAGEALLAADWIGVNCYWTDRAGMDDLNAGRLYEEYRLLVPQKLLLITEFGNPSADVTAEEKARQYLEFYRSLRERSGIGAAFAVALSAASGFDNLVWSSAEGSGRIPSMIGKRSF